MDITLTRGDTHLITFKVQDENNEDYILQPNDKLYFTVKKNWFDTNCVIQKTYNDGITFNNDTGFYEIELEQSCSCELNCGNFVYDIEIIIDNAGKPIIKTLVKGTLTFDKEVTHKGNE